MLKKILLGVVVLGVVIVAVLGYGTYKVADDFMKEKEPLLRQYVQMDVDAQNKFITDNVSGLLAGIDIDKDGKPEDKEQLELMKKANENPEIKQALADVGRSFLASVIVNYDPIKNTLNAEDQAKYQKESEQFDARLDKYTKLLEASGVKIDKE